MKVTAAEPGKVPAEVRKYLKDKGLTPSWDWDDVWQEEHAAAFTAAKAMGQDVLDALRKAVDAAIEGGQPFPEFKKRVRAVLAELGWCGVQDRANPKTGEVERVELGTPRRLKTIDVINARVARARAVGQWERIQRTKDARSWLVYELGASERHRPEHAAWAGKVLKVDDRRGARCSRRTGGAAGAGFGSSLTARPTTWAARARPPAPTLSRLASTPSGPTTPAKRRGGVELALGCARSVGGGARDGSCDTVGRCI